MGKLASPSCFVCVCVCVCLCMCSASVCVIVYLLYRGQQVGLLDDFTSLVNKRFGDVSCLCGHIFMLCAFDCYVFVLYLCVFLYAMCV